MLRPQKMLLIELNQEFFYFVGKLRQCLRRSRHKMNESNRLST